MPLNLKNGAYYFTTTNYTYKLEQTEALFADQSSIDLNSIEKMTDNYALLATKQNVAGENLPFGTYRHKSEGYSAPERLIPTTHRDDLYLVPSTLAALRGDIDHFLTSKAIYDRFQVIYKRGYLLHGAPGNGKTSLIRSLVKQYETQAHIIWTNNIPSTELCDFLNTIETTKIIIFEELVNRNISDSMTEFLEFLDGESSLKNCIVIATTNSPELLAANLANRPSRFDVVTEIGNPDKASSVAALKHWAPDLEFTESDIPFGKLSFAQMKEIALLSALNSISIKDALVKVQSQSDAFQASFAEIKKMGIKD